MSDTLAPSSGGVSGWVSTHKPAAAGGAAAAAVLAYALYRRHAAGAAGTTAATSAAIDPTTGLPVSGVGGIAGLTSDGTDLQTSIENWVQDALNTQNAQLQADLNNPGPPKPPPSPTPAPKPGAGVYKIVRGDTLAKIATVTLGSAAQSNIHAIKVANPILMSFPNTAPLTYFIGDTIKIPAAPHAPAPPPKKTPPPKKKPPKKPPKKKP